MLAYVVSSVFEQMETLAHVVIRERPEWYFAAAGVLLCITGEWKDAGMGLWTVRGFVSILSHPSEGWT